MPWPVGEEGPEFVENAGWDADKDVDLSDWYDCDRPVMGTVKLLTLTSDERASLEACEVLLAISAGTSSAAGIGSPRAAATSCASVHESE